MKPTFSVVLIARNEEHKLPHLIESLNEFKSLGGEILLLDTGSTDKTVEVAKQLGCNVQEVGEKFLITLTKEQADSMNLEFSKGKDFNIVNEGDKIFDYSSARNYIAEFANTDMIATPDCDEVYTKFNIDEINKVIEEGARQLEYNFVFSHDANGNELIKFRHCKFYNRKKLKWTGVIHEVLTPIDTMDQMLPVFLGEDIIKLEHWQNEKTNRTHYLTGLAYDCFMNPENDRNAHYFGRELFYRGYNESAIAQLKKHIDMNMWPTERSQSMIFIGDCYMNLEDKDEAFKYYNMAIDIEGNRREPFMKMAEYYFRAGKPDQTISYLNAALSIKGGDFYANYQPYYENLPHELMYWALWQKEAHTAAKAHFDVCMGYQPFNPKYLFDMRFFYDLPKIDFIIPTLGRKEGLERCVNSIKKLNYPQEKINIYVVSDNTETGHYDNLYKDTGIKVVSTQIGMTVPNKLKLGVELGEGDWIVYASNDIEFEPDSIISALKTAWDNSKKFMAFNTGIIGPDKGNICEHFMIRHDLIEKLGGEIFDTEFHHVGVDNLLHAKLERMNQFMRCERAIVKHYHFSRTGEEMDEVYKIAWNEEDVRKDRELLEKKLLELSQPNTNG